VFRILTSMQVTVNVVLCGENQLKSVRHGVYCILFTWDMNVCVILCIMFASLIYSVLLLSVFLAAGC